MQLFGNARALIAQNGKPTHQLYPRYWKKPTGNNIVGNNQVDKLLKVNPHQTQEQTHPSPPW